jgi:hypothetical protein
MGVYEGKILDTCGTLDVDFTTSYVIAVSGDGPNVCGHMLIYAAGKRGYYFHVAGNAISNYLTAYPHYMDDAGYRRYIKESGKRELRRVKVAMSNPDGALLYLEEVMSKKWTWGVLPNNCVAFVEELVKAGGGDWGGSYSNCPALATADSIQTRVNHAMATWTSEIYRAYGVSF